MGTCREDGQPLPSVVTISGSVTVNPPEHLRFIEEQVGIGAFSMDELVSHEYRCEQITISLSEIPTSAGVITLTKDSVAGSNYDTILKVWDPVSLNSSNFVCVTSWMFYTGDRVSLTYSNPDDLTVAAEVLLVRVD